MNPKSHVALAEYRERINNALELFYVGVPDLLQLELSETSQDALAKLKEFSLRPGKRLRGALAAAAYDQASGKKFGEAGIHLAVALELVQNYLLIVDDVMDESELRRGRPTFHKIYFKERRNLRESEMLAINAGLIAQHLANLALLQANEKPERILAALHSLHVNVTATGFGQIEDLLQRIGGKVSSCDIIGKYCLKTSYYTFINPLEAGLALAGNSSDNVRTRVREFGEPAGIAFQLQDDYLGIFGDETRMGKSNLDDIKEGKYTMLVQQALENGIRADTVKLERILGDKNAGGAELIQVREILDRAGATIYVQAEAKRYAEIAKQKAMKATIWSEDFKELLVSLIDFSLSRQL